MNKQAEDSTSLGGADGERRGQPGIWTAGFVTGLPESRDVSRPRPQDIGGRRRRKIADRPGNTRLGTRIRAALAGSAIDEEGSLVVVGDSNVGARRSGMVLGE